MGLDDLAEKYRKMADELPRQLAQERVDGIQRVYDRVLAVAQGPNTEEVKILLTQGWMEEFESSPIAAGFLDNAEALARGGRVQLNLHLKILMSILP